jgi:hypothetical protein
MGRSLGGTTAASHRLLNLALAAGFIGFGRGIDGGMENEALKVA